MTQNGSSNSSTFLRQMSLEECCKKTKYPSFRMAKPFIVSNVCITIGSSDEEEEDPSVPLEGDRKDGILPYPSSRSSEFFVRENKQEKDQDSFGAATDNNEFVSPSKKAKLMIGVYKPSSSVKEEQSSLPIVSNVVSINTTPNRQQKGISDTPTSSCSDRTMICDYSEYDTFDASTVPFAPPSLIEERLVLNDPRDCASSDLTENANDSTDVTIAGAKNPVARRLDFAGAVGNGLNKSINEPTVTVHIGGDKNVIKKTSKSRAKNTVTSKKVKNTEKLSKKGALKRPCGNVASSEIPVDKNQDNTNGNFAVKNTEGKKTGQKKPRKKVADLETPANKKQNKNSSAQKSSDGLNKKGRKKSSKSKASSENPTDKILGTSKENVTPTIQSANMSPGTENAIKHLKRNNVSVTLTPNPPSSPFATTGWISKDILSIKAAAPPPTNSPQTARNMYEGINGNKLHIRKTPEKQPSTLQKSRLWTPEQLRTLPKNTKPTDKASISKATVRVNSNDPKVLKDMYMEPRSTPTTTKEPSSTTDIQRTDISVTALRMMYVDKRSEQSVSNQTTPSKNQTPFTKKAADASSASNCSSTTTTKEPSLTTDNQRTDISVTALRSMYVDKPSEQLASNQTTPSKNQTPFTKKTADASLALNQTTPSKNQTHFTKNTADASSASNQTTPSKNQTPVEKKTVDASCSTPKSERKRRYNSPESPYKNPPVKRVIKNLKAVEGKELLGKRLEEFVKLIKIVQSKRHLYNLLTAEDKSTLTRFEEMEDDEKYVAMTLHNWKRIWYNIHDFTKKAKIQYDKDEINRIFECLGQKGFVDTELERGDMVELLNALDVQRIRAVATNCRIKSSATRKDDIIGAIVREAIHQTTLVSTTTRKDHIMKEIKKQLGFAVKLKRTIYQTFYHTFLLATFTNPDLTDIQRFFLRFTNESVVYPEAPVEDWPVFSSRRKFLEYAAAVEKCRELDDMLKKKERVNYLFDIAKDVYEKLKEFSPASDQEHPNAPHLKQFSAQHQYTSILTRCCDQLYAQKNDISEHVKTFLDFLIDRFPQSRRLGQWYEKLIRLHMSHLEKLDCEKGAKKAIEIFESGKLGERGKYEMGRLARTLMSSKKGGRMAQIYHDRLVQLIPKEIDINKFPTYGFDSPCLRTNEPGKKRTYISKSQDGTILWHVEQLALEDYAENGFPGGDLHEGALIKGLMMLYFWDIIYNEKQVIPGTFISTFQDSPLDINYSFFEKRSSAILTRLTEIEERWNEEQLIKFGTTNYDKHSHKTSVYGRVMDKIGDKKMVDILFKVIGRKVLAKIFRRILEDVKEHSSGMPDLLVWNVDERKHKFVEVKGENDSLSIRQKMWLSYLQECGASIEVCLVHSLGSRRKKIRKIVAQEEDVASTSKS